MDYRLYRKWRSWGRGVKEKLNLTGRRSRAVRIWFAEVFLQRQLFGLSSFRWLIHLLIFWGFAALLFLSLALFVFKPLDLLGIDWGLSRFFLKGAGHLFIKIWGDVFGLMLLLGLAAAGIRRLFFRPAQQVNDQLDVFLLVYLVWMTLSGFGLEGLRLMQVPQEVARYSFVGQFFMPAGAYAPAELTWWLTVCWSIHAFTGAALLFYLPHSKLMHSILSPLVIGLNAIEEQERKDLYWPEIAKHRPTGLPRA